MAEYKLSQNAIDKESKSINTMEYKSFAVKSFDEYKGEVTGYGVTYGNKDRVNDVILKGALTEGVKEYNNGKPISFLFEHEYNYILNSNIESIVDGRDGAIVKARVSEEAKARYPQEYKSIIQAFQNRTAYLSIGYAVTESKIKNGIRYIKNLKIYEFSFTTNPANLKAQIMEVKSINIPKYPILLNEEWNSDLAEARWRAYTNSTEAPTEMYKKGFLYYNPEQENDFAGYKLQIADVINGEPMINESAVITVYQAMQGARGGLKVVPNNQMPALIAVIKELYSKINNVRKQESIEEMLEDPDFKMYEIEEKINNIHTKCYAEKFCRQHKNDFCMMSESQFKRFIGKVITIGYKVYKDKIENKLDIQEKEVKNIVNHTGSPSCETRSSQDSVQGQQVNWSTVAQFIKTQ